MMGVFCRIPLLVEIFDSLVCVVMIWSLLVMMPPLLLNCRFSAVPLNVSVTPLP